MRSPVQIKLLISWILIATSFALADQPRKVVRIGEINFTLQEGYDLNRVAAEPLTKWPVVADWDSQGNLLIVESAGVGKPIVEHNKQQLHRIIRLLDRDQDGQFDQRVVVADGLPFVEGVLALGNDLLACAPPNIYRLTDSDGDGVYEARDIWFDGQTITGCANDLHGPYLGRDGWIYWCKGAFAEQNHKLINGKQLKTTAAHIFRRRIDGGEIEPVMTGGMDNPVEVAVNPEGERFFTSTFLQHPGNGLRDGIGHAVYGGVFGKQHKVIDDHVRTGPLMPIMTQLGPAAPSGLICLESDALVTPIEPNRNTLVAALFNLQKVTAHHLQPKGASYSTSDQDLVVADRIDFHPTDILEDADGSLLIIDTGGWYDLCCPTSRIDQKTASGGIYRLSRTPDVASRKPAVQRNQTNLDSSSLNLSQLTQQLHDVRPWVARSALLYIARLTGQRANECVNELSREAENRQLQLSVRLQSLWALCAIDNEQSLAAVSRLIGSDQSSLAQAACNAVSLHRFTPARSDLEKAVQHAATSVRRAAAEALGRIGDPKSTSALMESLPTERLAFDRALEHSVTYALIEIRAVDEIAQFADSKRSPRQQQAAITALDQLGDIDKLSVDFMLSAANHSDSQLSECAAETLGRHPEWATRFASRIADLFNKMRDNGELPVSLMTVSLGWRDTSPIKEIIGASLKSASSESVQIQIHLNQLLGMYAGTSIPVDWDQSIADWLVKADSSVRDRLLQTLTRINLADAKGVKQSLLLLAQKSQSDMQRLNYLAALPNGTTTDDSLEATLLSSLQSADVANGQAAFSALQRVKLSPDAGKLLLTKLQHQPPRDLAVTVEAIQRLGNDELDESMLIKLADLPSAKALSMDQLLNLYRKRGDKLRGMSEQTIAKLGRASEDIEVKLDEMLAKLGPGDPIRGLQLFRSSKTACSGCHRLGYVGGEIGPELSRIGASRTRRAMLEAILFPSARLEQSYQPTRVLTSDGHVYNGLVKKTSTSKTIELQLTVDKSISISADEIERQEPSQLSIMPAGMLELLSTDELSDLLALLESGK